jgi:hypothetical protein
VLVLRIQLKAILEKQLLVVQDDINLNPNIKKVVELVLQNILLLTMLQVQEQVKYHRELILIMKPVLILIHD